MTLRRRAWVRLNRLRTGVGRFRSCLYNWGITSSSAWECGAEEQTSDHVCHLHTQQTSRKYTKNYARAFYLRLNNASHMAVATSMCHVGRKSARLISSAFSQPQLGLTLKKLLRFCFSCSTRRGRSDEKKLSIPSTSRTPAVRGGAPSTNLLAGPDNLLFCAPSQQNSSLNNL